MSLPIERELSDENSALLETRQLGKPVGIYPVRPLYMRTMRVGALFSLGLGISLLIFLSLISIIQWPREQANELPGIVIVRVPLLLSLSIFLLFVGVFLLRVEIPRARKVCIIACEHGLLFVGKGAGNQGVEALHWSDILTIRTFKNPYGKYIITYKDNKVMSLDSIYQDVDELIEAARLRIERV
ncbi:MAG: hypothetical protein M3Z08_21715 [Chloroflexota bacterium]|nr:hypothetical protein [Chloroflexota bacterium]